MALTMTRTRTQKALTDLCRMVANVHGELEFVDWALQHRQKERQVLLARREQLLRERDALYGTLRVFNPALDPAAEIGSLTEWLKPYGRKVSDRAAGRYVRAHAPSQTHAIGE